jgi:hypothetical protein
MEILGIEALLVKRRIWRQGICWNLFVSLTTLHPLTPLFKKSTIPPFDHMIDTQRLRTVLLDIQQHNQPNGGIWVKVQKRNTGDFGQKIRRSRQECGPGASARGRFSGRNRIALRPVVLELYIELNQNC